MKLDLIEQPTKNCNVCAAETDPEDSFCQECGVSLGWDEPEPETLTRKVQQLQGHIAKLFGLIPKLPSLTGIPKLPTAAPPLIGLAILLVIVPWCVQSIDKSFDSMSEDYIGSAALKALKNHNSTEAAELLLRFHLEHSGKMSVKHLALLGQCLLLRADEAIQSKDYSKGLNYLNKVPSNCPQYAAAQTKIQDLKDHGLTITVPVVANPPVPAATAAPIVVQEPNMAAAGSKTTNSKAPTSPPSPAGQENPGNTVLNSSAATEPPGNEETVLQSSTQSKASESANTQNSLLVPQVVPPNKNSEIQESKLQSSIPIWQRFSHPTATGKSHTGVSSSGASISTTRSGSASNLAPQGSEGGGIEGNGSSGISRSDSTPGNASSGTGGNGDVNVADRICAPSPQRAAPEKTITENERDKPKASGFFIDGKEITHDSRGQEPERILEKGTEPARKGPKSRAVEGQKSYNPDDISRYNELLANYFSQHDASSPKSADKHSNGAEPPSFQEWVIKGKPSFR
jgi:hypothetical protein